MRIFLLVLIGGAVCFNYIQSVTVSDAFWKTLVQLPFFVLTAWIFDAAGRFSISRWRWTGSLVYMFFAFYALVTVAECYLCLFVKSGYTSSILTFLFQTNAGESRGFVDAYLTNKMFFIFAGTLAVSAVLVLVVELFLPEHIMPQTWSGMLVMTAFLLALMFPVYPCTSVSRLADSFYHYCEIRSDEGRLCHDTKVYGANHVPHDVVLIIGEAFSKHHSSLYGYVRQTNPCLEKLIESGNLFLFNDVIAPYNKTHMILKELLSVHSVDSPKAWNEYPLWPQIFKDGGYHVSFVSNQVPSAASDDRNVYFFQDKDVEQRCFDYRNNYVYRYDEGLLNELQKISSFCTSPNQLTILHLNGQHIYAVYNFPHERFTVFRSSDYIPNSLDLDSRQVQELADYDNATLYNDYVVSRIMKWYDDREAVVVYLSDHGEEVHDYRPFLGRSHAQVPTRNEIRHQYEVPFMIYVTDAYKRQNPDVVKEIQDFRFRKFMSDDLCHMLLGLSGIQTEWYDPARDILSHDYDTTRIRIFGY